MMDVTKGLEVKVKLGQVWKRKFSRIIRWSKIFNCSFINMALLQFKAPMYILDEVDAALDLSHSKYWSFD